MENKTVIGPMLRETLDRIEMERIQKGYYDCLYEYGGIFKK